MEDTRSTKMEDRCSDCSNLTSKPNCEWFCYGANCPCSEVIICYEWDIPWEIEPEVPNSHDFVGKKNPPR